MTKDSSSDTVVVGLVRRPHGVRGEVVVEPTTDVPERFSPGANLVLIDADERRRVVEVATVRSHRGVLLVRFSGYDDRDGAGELRGSTVAVTAAEVPPAPDGSYYYYELVGCGCRDSEGAFLGEVTEIVEDGGGLLLSLADGDRQLLVPFVREFVRAIDIDDRLIELDLPPGLLESCVSPS